MTGVICSLLNFLLKVFFFLQCHSVVVVTKTTDVHSSKVTLLSLAKTPYCLTAACEISATVDNDGYKTKETHRATGDIVEGVVTKRPKKVMMDEARKRKQEEP